MTISSTTRKAGPTPGNGVAISFPFAFKVFETSEVVVTLSNLSTGAQSTLTLNTDYTVSLNADQDAAPGGSVTYSPAAGPLTSTYSLTISSAVEPLQETDLTSGGAFLPQVVEDMADKATINIQQLKEVIGRSLSFPVTDPAASSEGTLPAYTLRANMLLSFDANGNLQVVAPAAQSATALSLQLAASTGASLIGGIQSGTGAVTRTEQDKNRDTASPEDYGAAGNGTTTDSGSVNSAITAKRNITPAAGKSYAVANLTLSNSQSIEGKETVFSAATGATNLVTLGGYKPTVSDLYVSDGRNASGPLFKLISGRYQRLHNVAVVNAGAGGGIQMTDTNSTGVNRSTITNVDIEDFTTAGLSMGSSVSELRADNMILSGIIDYISMLGKPRAGSVGWRQNTPVVSGLAVGGHQVSNVNCITCDNGFWLTDASLSKYSNIIADSCSDFGVKIDGASGNLDFADLFVGTSMGFYVGGSSVVSVDGLRTVFNGAVPPWGQPSFFNGTAYDITVAGTAVLTVKGWRGEKKVNVASTAKLIVLDGTTYVGRTLGTIAAGSTVYIAEWGSTPTENDACWRAPCAGRLMRLRPVVTSAPGVGQSFTYTARAAGADTSLVATIIDANFGSVDFWASTGGIAVTAGQTISIKLVTSAGATASRHYCEFQFIPD